MQIQITRREVLNNLMRFRDNLLAKRASESEPDEERVYSAFFNRHTGDIQFETGAHEERIRYGGAPADWKEIHFLVAGDPDSVRFRLTGSRGEPFNPVDFDPLAIRILFETLNALNRLAFLYSHPKAQQPEAALLEHIGQIHVSPIHESVEKRPEWAGGLTRLEAERELANRMPGSFLLHHGDEVVGWIARVLAETNNVSIKVYVATFVEQGKKISDSLLIQTEWGWTVCRDESDLSDPVYQYNPSLDALLESLRDRAIQPR